MKQITFLLSLAAVWLGASSQLCPLDVFLDILSTRNTILETVLGSGEFVDTDFEGQQDLTYLCYSRDSTDPLTYGSVRVSVTFTYKGNMRAFRTSLVCPSAAAGWRYLLATTGLAVETDVSEHPAANTTMDGCMDCFDSSTENLPMPDASWCNVTNPCGPSTCANSGTCNRLGLTATNCTCSADYMGDTCQTGNPCTTVANPCMNGGTCTPAADFLTFDCSCVAPWTSTVCNTCARTCTNGGTLNSAACTCGCLPGVFTGDVCQTCARVCQHEGLLDASACSCSCRDVTSGDFCESCDLTCVNGGTLDSDKCTCTCANGFMGEDCSSVQVGNNNNNPGAGLSPGGIAGLIIGCFLFVLLVVAIVIIATMVVFRHVNKKAIDDQTKHLKKDQD